MERRRPRYSLAVTSACAAPCDISPLSGVFSGRVRSIGAGHATSDVAASFDVPSPSILATSLSHSAMPTRKVDAPTSTSSQIVSPHLEANFIPGEKLPSESSAPANGRKEEGRTLDAPRTLLVPTHPVIPGPIAPLVKPVTATASTVAKGTKPTVEIQRGTSKLLSPSQPRTNPFSTTLLLPEHGSAVPSISSDPSSVTAVTPTAAKRKRTGDDEGSEDTAGPDTTRPARTAAKRVQLGKTNKENPRLMKLVEDILRILRAFFPMTCITCPLCHSRFNERWAESTFRRHLTSSCGPIREIVWDQESLLEQLLEQIEIVVSSVAASQVGDVDRDQLQRLLTQLSTPDGEQVDSSSDSSATAVTSSASAIPTVMPSLPTATPYVLPALTHIAGEGASTCIGDTQRQHEAWGSLTSMPSSTGVTHYQQEIVSISTSL